MTALATTSASAESVKTAMLMPASTRWTPVAAARGGAIPSSSKVTCPAMSGHGLGQLQELRGLLGLGGEVLPGGLAGDGPPLLDVGIREVDHLDALGRIGLGDLLVVLLGLLGAEGLELGAGFHHELLMVGRERLV